FKGEFLILFLYFRIAANNVVVVIDYQAGNITSVVRSLRALGVDSTVTEGPEKVLQARRVIFPGVGAAGEAMATLKRRGLDQALQEVFSRNIPILGICLGAQIVLDYSEENDTPCLGLIPGRTRALPRGPGLKIPHMGWNRVDFRGSHPVFAGLPATAEYYFVHSFFPEPREAAMVLGITEHGVAFPSALGSQNLVATQFHPEKSGRYGLKILENFLAWDGRYAE
ncbi:MAG: imidazole glycerol phosphate synthase subunit HisH, partial [Syntrophobacterales bacterium]